VGVLGWIIAAGIFLYGMSATYQAMGVGGSVLWGGFWAFMYWARVSRAHLRAQSQRTILNAYGRAALGNLLEAYARDRGRPPSNREQLAALAKLAALMQLNHDKPLDLMPDPGPALARSRAMHDLFEPIYGYRPTSFREEADFGAMIGGAYPKEGSASASAADASGQDLPSPSVTLRPEQQRP
jgi:hypothetical protein